MNVQVRNVNAATSMNETVAESLILGAYSVILLLLKLIPTSS